MTRSGPAAQPAGVCSRLSSWEEDDDDDYCCGVREQRVMCILEMDYNGSQKVV